MIKECIYYEYQIAADSITQSLMQARGGDLITLFCRCHREEYNTLSVCKEPKYPTCGGRYTCDMMLAYIIIICLLWFLFDDHQARDIYLGPDINNSFSLPISHLFNACKVAL